MTTLLKIIVFVSIIVAVYWINYYFFNLIHPGAPWWAFFFH